MTPMVDLAFLLLTFFVLTTNLNKAVVMRIDVPEEVKDEKDIPLVNSSRVLTLVLSSKEKIYWYRGVEHKIELTNFSRNGISRLLLEKNRQIKKMMVLIKPSDQSRYKNLVDILDELSIANIEHYALVDITQEDIDLIRKSNQ